MLVPGKALLSKGVGEPSTPGQTRVVKVRRGVLAKRKSPLKKDPELKRIGRKGHIARSVSGEQDSSRNQTHGIATRKIMAVPHAAKNRLKTSAQFAIQTRAEPHQRGHDARDDKEQQPGCNIHQPKLLVVDRVNEFLHDRR